ncbi:MULTISPECIES: hypothetical protein [Paraburkholderia]|uniref:hypothetical protein n=1 Tax=Paraburkholderia TaxID=1822464 RepID=UPI0038BCD205
MNQLKSARLPPASKNGLPCFSLIRTIGRFLAVPVWHDLDASIDKTIELINEAAGNGVSLITFPET